MQTDTWKRNLLMNSKKEIFLDNLCTYDILLIYVKNDKITTLH